MVFREINTPALYTAGRALFHFNLVILDFNIVILGLNDDIEIQLEIFRSISER